MKIANPISKLLTIAFFVFNPSPINAAHSKNEAVILIHGMSRTSAHLRHMEEALCDAGYTVINIDYPSTKYTIEEHINSLSIKLESVALEEFSAVHFVGHSMGGLLARGIVFKDRPKNLGRVVQIASPNKGSEVADFWKDYSLFKWLYGPAGQQLTTNYDYSKILGPVDYELGVIAGNRTIDPISSRLIPGDNDGRVSVESTKVEGMKDHIVIPATHTFITSNDTAQDHVLQFLKFGTFLRKPEKAKNFSKISARQTS